MTPEEQRRQAQLNAARKAEHEADLQRRRQASGTIIGSEQWKREREHYKQELYDDAVARALKLAEHALRESDTTRTSVDFSHVAAGDVEETVAISNDVADVLGERGFKVEKKIDTTTQHFEASGATPQSYRTDIRARLIISSEES
jgi:hypothetical protein